MKTTSAIWRLCLNVYNNTRNAHFFQPSVSRPQSRFRRHTRSIVRAPEPRNIQELRSFLGLLNYYGKFIPNLSTLIHPLNSLLQKSKRWNWTADCKQAFNQAKQALSSSTVLVHYDPLRLAGDGSAYSIGAVILHILPDGSERPIAFASRALSDSERNYARLDLSLA